MLPKSVSKGKIVKTILDGGLKRYGSEQAASVLPQMIREKARTVGKRVVLPEGTDERVITL